MGVKFRFTELRMWDVELTTKPELEVASKPDVASIAAPTEQEQ